MVRSPIGGAGRWIGRSDLGGGSDGSIPIWDRSNLDRPSMIGRPGPIGAWGGGAGHRRLVSTAARGSGSPDFANSNAQMAKSSGAWVWDGIRDMHNPPRALAGLGRALGCGCDDGGGSARHGFASVLCSGCRNGLWSTISSAKGTREGAGAHRGLRLAGEAVQRGRRRWRAMEMRRRSWRELLQGFSRLLGPTGLPVVFLRR
jgi:hypothetical protein